MTLSDADIYRIAREAGFSPNQAVTMTAIALAESGGDPNALNPEGEHSVGLWQINLEAHPHFRAEDVYDPLVNAKLAFETSKAGTDIGRWTVTHQSKGARYLNFATRAEAAAASAGEDATGSWQPPVDYYSPKIAADVDEVATPGIGGDESGGTVAAAGPDEPADGVPLRTFLDAALAQDGDRYIFGATASPDDADPEAFDCAELVQWAAAQADVELPTGSWLQYLELKEQGGRVSLDKALETPGALVFKFSDEPVPGGVRPSVSHVAISLGDGDSLIEARNSSYGVGQFSASERGFTHAAVIPELGTELDDPVLVDPMVVMAGGGQPEADLEPGQVYDYNQDSDSDGLIDSLERYLGTDPYNPDTDLDGFTDADEATDFNTDPLDYNDSIAANLAGPEAAVNVTPPPTSAEQRAVVEEAARQQEAAEAAKAEAEAAAAEAEAQRKIEQAQAEAEAKQAAAQKLADDRYDEEVARQERQHDELVGALAGRAEEERVMNFSFDPTQESELDELGLDVHARDSLELAVRNRELDRWYADNLTLFEDTDYDGAQGLAQLQEFIGLDLFE